MRNFGQILILVLALLFSGSMKAQEKPLRKDRPPYDRKEEILFDGKRYRLYNNYLTLGPGFANSTIRTTSQKVLGLDFTFHIRRQYFQAGIMMSGTDFGNNNNVQGHLGWGLRKERNTSNLAAFIGPSFSSGVEGSAISGQPEFYQVVGVYASAQAIRKLLFDIGLGIEVFGDVSVKQQMFGFRIIAFFSGAYRGPKRNYNPNVRSENPK